MEHEKLACATFKYLGTMVVAHETAVTERSREYAWAQSLSPKLDTDLTRNTRAPHMAQKPVLRGEVGCACVAREVSVEMGGMAERGCARRLGGWVSV